MWVKGALDSSSISIFRHHIRFAVISFAVFVFSILVGGELLLNFPYGIESYLSVNGSIFCVEFQMCPLKLYTKNFTHRLKDVYCVKKWRLKSSWIYELGRCGCALYLPISHACVSKQMDGYYSIDSVESIHEIMPISTVKTGLSRI